MSTNYYWIYDEPKAAYIELPTGTKVKCHDIEVPYAGTHVGKRYGCGDANTAFILACDPDLLLQTLLKKKKYAPCQMIVEDEYGRQFNAGDFSILLYDNIRWELHAVGTVFC